VEVGERQAHPQVVGRERGRVERRRRGVEQVRLGDLPHDGLRQQRVLLPGIVLEERVDVDLLDPGRMQPIAPMRLVHRDAGQDRGVHPAGRRAGDGVDHEGPFLRTGGAGERLTGMVQDLEGVGELGEHARLVAAERAGAGDDERDLLGVAGLLPDVTVDRRQGRTS
jgi:hypothetical protein